jgi:hypothetical protein
MLRPTCRRGGDVSRNLEITVEGKVGQIHDFSVVIDGVERISGSGAQAHSWSGEVPDRVKVTAWATGVPGSQWELTVDLPGTVNDFTVRYTLSSALQKVEFDT